MTAFVATFLVVHGVLHLAVWLAPTSKDPDRPAPFRPDHSPLLTAAPPAVTHRLAVGLAAATAAAYVLAGVGVAVGASWAVPAAIAAAVLGLLLKVPFFHPWLTAGVLLDAVVLVVAIGA